MEAAQAAREKKATAIVVLEVGVLTTIADYMVICSAHSHRHVHAVMQHIEHRLKERKARPVGIEGTDASAWILMDYGDIMIHIFTEDIREHYGLERLWGDAPSQIVEDESSTMTAGRVTG